MRFLAASIVATVIGAGSGDFLSAQELLLDSIVSFGSATDDLARTIAVDGSGNIYVSGTYNGTVDFDPGPGTVNLTATGPATDVYVLKLDSSWNLLWAKSVGGTGTDQGVDMCLDSAGNVYVVGAFSGSGDFDPGAGTATLSHVNGDDVYVLKLDGNGSLVYARAIGGSGNELAFGVAADGSQNVYVVGRFQNTVDFDPGAGTANLTSAGSYDIFVLKLDSSGNYSYAADFGDTGSDQAKSVAVDSTGNPYVLADFAGTVDFDPGAGTTALTSAGLADAAIIKLDTSGNLVYAKSFGGTGQEEASHILVNGAGSLFLTGLFNATADFDPGIGTQSRTSNGGADAYVLKLDASGDFVYASTVGGTGSDSGYGLALDGFGNVYSVGLFNNTVDFDPGAGTADLTDFGGGGVFLQILDSDGDYLLAEGFGGTAYDLGFSVAVDASGTIYIAGLYSETVDFDPGTAINNHTSVGQVDIFAMALDRANNPPTADFTITPNPANDGSLVTLDGTASTDADIPFGDSIILYEWDLDSNGTYDATGSIHDFPASVSSSITLRVTDSSSATNTTTRSLTVNPVPPTADTIAPDTVGPTNASSVDFTVTFSEDVVNFNDASDVVVSHTGTAHTGVSISGGPATYTVSVTGISGDGSFTLAVDTGSDVEDIAGNALSSSVTSGAVTIDNTAPVASVGAPSLSETNAGPVDYLVTYTGADNVNLVPGDVTLNASGATGTVSVTYGTTATPTVTISAISGDGTLGISIAGGTSSDTAGNVDAGAGPSATFTVDNTAPTVSIGAPSTSATNVGPVDYVVTYAGADSVNLTPGDVTLNATGATGTVSVTNGTTATPTVTISAISGDGTLGISIGGGTSSDTTGNADAGAGPSATFSVDNTPPVIALLGSNPIQVDQYTSYVDPGATATDTLDGNLSAQIVVDSSSVDTDTTGFYIVTYDVSDAAGNPATQATRTVEVVSAAASLPAALLPGLAALALFMVLAGWLTLNHKHTETRS